MADSTLEERLREHAESFDGLLSLIPAKHYYGEDNSDQWKKKKQTKEQAAAARRAKLDPDSDKLKSAKDIMDERVRKRKAAEAELEADEEESDIEGVEKEQPKQGLKVPQEKKQKKQKVAPESESKDNTNSAETKISAAAEKLERLRLKQERKKEKKSKKAEKAEQKKDKVTTAPETKVAKAPAPKKADAEDGGVDVEEAVENEIVGFESEGLEGKPASSTSPSPGPQSPTFDSSSKPPSTTNTSTTSTIPPATAPRHIKLPADPEILRARLTARIEALRAARKADGPDGTPARNRQELLESRRKKEEQRRAHKKQLRLQAKIEEEEQREAAIASARDSPASSMMSPSVYSPPQNFSFGRVAFADGQQLGDDLTTTHAPKKKGPQDPATALQATENKRLRLAGLDDKKRADIEEKDLWLNAKRKAHGEKVRDDTSLLKKTLKRKEKMKKKSEKEWTERKEGVAKGIAMKQKKREENLQKRRDGKGTKGGKVKSKGGKPKVKSRPGFEGSFSSKRK